MLPKEHTLTLSLTVKLIENGGGVFGYTGREHDDLIVLAHLENEFFSVRPNHHKYRLQLPIDINGLLDIGIPDFFEARVHQSLVKIEDQRFLSPILINLWF